MRINRLKYVRLDTVGRTRKELWNGSSVSRLMRKVTARI